MPLRGLLSDKRFNRVVKNIVVKLLIFKQKGGRIPRLIFIVRYKTLLFNYRIRAHGAAVAALNIERHAIKVKLLGELFGIG